MKTLPIITFLAALVAFAFSSHSLAVAGSLFFAVGFVTIFAADYSRVIKPLNLRAEVTGFSRPTRQAQAFELAA